MIRIYISRIHQGDKISHLRTVLFKCIFLVIFLFSIHQKCYAKDTIPYHEPCLNAEAAENCEVPFVSLINLIATPERYHLKRVSVVGFASFAFEDTSLSFLPNSSEQESLWLSIFDSDFKTNSDVDQFKKKLKDWQKKFHKKRVLVEGTFDMKSKGHLGMFIGSIYNITRIEIYDTKAERTPQKK